jgi:membrane fusion protein (multidrug efflux system)
VRAPFAGTITKRHVDVGNLVMTSSAVFDLDDVSALELDLYLPEREAAAVSVDAPVRLTLLDGASVPGRVVRRAPVVDATTGTVKVTVRIGGPTAPPAADASAATDAADAARQGDAATRPSGAIPGAFVRAGVLVEHRVDAPSLPKTAVFEHEGEPHVYAVDGDKTRRTKVRVGMSSSDRMEILEGLAPDAIVVADATGGIVEGMPISPVDATGAAIGGTETPSADPSEGRDRRGKAPTAGADAARRGG